MVTVVRQFAAPVSLMILILFVAAPGLVWAGSQPDPGVIPTVAAPPSEAALSPDAAPSRSLAALAGIPADLAPPSEDRAAGQSPQWFDANASPAGGGWWSRRTTAQKTWFIVGLVAGAYGIYAIASNGSKSHHNGGGGIGY